MASVFNPYPPVFVPLTSVAGIIVLGVPDIHARRRLKDGRQGVVARVRCSRSAALSVAAAAGHIFAVLLGVGQSVVCARSVATVC